MYQKLLVPLDGSDLAEVVLPHVEYLAKGWNIAEVHLISVTEVVKGQVSRAEALEQVKPDETVIPPLQAQKLEMQPGTVGGPLYPSESYRMFAQPVTLGRMAATAEEYLEKKAEVLEKKGLKTCTTVLAGRPAEEIARYAESEHMDLIIMASRGRSGFSRWDMGNIAEKVIRIAKIPVLLIKPELGFKETKPERHGDSAMI
jgi:nucleotide-binding universal stress UspA family protein